MKNLSCILIALFIINIANAQYVSIPDPHFVAWLNTNIPTAMNGNQMDTTSNAVLTLTRIDVENDSIIDLTGIQYFLSLKTLDCGNGYGVPNPNSISFLPPLPTTLDTLICGRNFLTNLPSLPSTLRVLICYRNQLSILPPLPSSLTKLDCDVNQLTSLPPLPNTLIFLTCSYNNLTSLPVLSSSMWNLSCGDNQLTSLPTLPNTLTRLYCPGNLITSLPLLPNSLDDLTCPGNQITNLPGLPNSLSLLNCSSNQITNLPVLPSSLTSFYCAHNQITILPTLPSTLAFFNCRDNNISCFPTFPTTLINPSFFFISENPFSCLPNYVSAMNAGTLAYPLCVAGDSINNIFNCSGSEGITGFIFKDNNTNCIIDSGDLNIINAHVMLYDNNNILLGQTYSAINGIYDFPDTVGTYTVKIDTTNVPFMVQCINPGIDSTVTLTTTNPLVNNVDFSFVCKPGFDVGVQSVFTNNYTFPGQIHSLRIVAGDLSQWYHHRFSRA